MQKEKEVNTTPITKTFEETWNNCLKLIRDNVSPQNFKTWFEPIKAVKLDALTLTIEVPSQFVYEWLEEHYIGLLRKTIRYIKPAYYDDQLTIKVRIPVLPKARIFFEYETFNESGELLNNAATTLVFINKSTGKPCSAPKDVMRRMSKFYAG